NKSFSFFLSFLFLLLFGKTSTDARFFHGFLGGKSCSGWIHQLLLHNGLNIQIVISFFHHPNGANLAMTSPHHFFENTQGKRRWRQPASGRSKTRRIRPTSGNHSQSPLKLGAIWSNSQSGSRAYLLGQERHPTENHPTQTESTTFV